MHIINIRDIMRAIHQAIDDNERYIIANHNLHSVYLYYALHSRMPSFYNKSTYTHIDGMALLLIGRLLGHVLKVENRITMLDLIPNIISRASDCGWRIFYLGSKQGVADKGATILKSQYRQLNMATHHGYFDASCGSPDNRTIVQLINEYKPHILMVGMGMPRQEEWIADNFEHLHVNAILNTGAYIDYVAGEIPTPPRWLGPVGLEWLYRLLSEPKRLWRRYLVEPWFVMGLIAKDAVRKFS